MLPEPTIAAVFLVLSVDVMLHIFLGLSLALAVTPRRLPTRFRVR